MRASIAQHDTGVLKKREILVTENPGNSELALAGGTDSAAVAPSPTATGRPQCETVATATTEPVRPSSSVKEITTDTRGASVWPEINNS